MSPAEVDRENRGPSSVSCLGTSSSSRRSLTHEAIEATGARGERKAEIEQMVGLMVRGREGARCGGFVGRVFFSSVVSIASVR